LLFYDTKDPSYEITEDLVSTYEKRKYFLLEENISEHYLK